MPEVFDLSDPLGSAGSSDGNAPGSKPALEIGSAGQKYKSKRKKPQPPSPRKQAVTVAVLTLVILAAVVAVGIALFGHRDKGEDAAVAPVLPAGSAAGPASGPHLRSPAPSLPNRGMSGAGPGFAPDVRDMNRDAPAGEGIH